MKDWKSFELEVKRKQVDGRSVRIERPADMAGYFNMVAEEEMGECLFIAHLDGRNTLIGFEKIYSGTSTGLSVKIGEVLRSVIASSAAGFVLVHNHPSGDPQPSDEDYRLTSDVLKAARLMDIEFLDHLVIGENKFSSCRSEKPGIWEAA